MKFIKKVKEVTRAFGVTGGIKLSVLHLLKKRKIHMKLKDCVKIWLREIDEYIYIRPYTSDIELLVDMLYCKAAEGKYEYEIDWKDKVNTPSAIIDAGANIGIFSIIYTKIFPDAKIIAFEPEETNFQMLVKNTQKFENIICEKAGIWCRDAYLQVVPRDTGKWGFCVKEVSADVYGGGERIMS